MEEVNRKTGGTADTQDAEVVAASTLTEELSAAIAELPKLKETKRVLDMHTNLARMLLEQVQQRTLNEYWDLQADIVVRWHLHCTRARAHTNTHAHSSCGAKLIPWAGPGGSERRSGWTRSKLITESERHSRGQVEATAHLLLAC